MLFRVGSNFGYSCVHPIFFTFHHIPKLNSLWLYRSAKYLSLLSKNTLKIAFLFLRLYIVIWPLNLLEAVNLQWLVTKLGNGGGKKKLTQQKKETKLKVTYLILLGFVFIDERKAFRSSRKHEDDILRPASYTFLQNTVRIFFKPGLGPSPENMRLKDDIDMIMMI
uniref:Uncharacterized protein n=1 Tax=Glossina pallidipes TaxID=7398 RepID=A0A1B0AJI4_GLOPL